MSPTFLSLLLQDPGCSCSSAWLSCLVWQISVMDAALIKSLASEHVVCAVLSPLRQENHLCGAVNRSLSVIQQGHKVRVRQRDSNILLNWIGWYTCWIRRSDWLKPAGNQSAEINSAWGAMRSDREMNGTNLCALKRAEGRRHRFPGSTRHPLTPLSDWTRSTRSQHPLKEIHSGMEMEEFNAEKYRAETSQDSLHPPAVSAFTPAVAYSRSKALCCVCMLVWLEFPKHSAVEFSAGSDFFFFL